MLGKEKKSAAELKNADSASMPLVADAFEFPDVHAIIKEEIPTMAEDQNEAITQTPAQILTHQVLDELNRKEAEREIARKRWLEELRKQEQEILHPSPPKIPRRVISAVMPEYRRRLQQFVARANMLCDALDELNEMNDWIHRHKIPLKRIYFLSETGDSALGRASRHSLINMRFREVEEILASTKPAEDIAA